jgi:hypothetical protein
MYVISTERRTVLLHRAHPADRMSPGSRTFGALAVSEQLSFATAGLVEVAAAARAASSTASERFISALR